MCAYVPREYTGKGHGNNMPRRVRERKSESDDETLVKSRSFPLLSVQSAPVLAADITPPHQSVSYIRALSHYGNLTK